MLVYGMRYCGVQTSWCSTFSMRCDIGQTNWYIVFATLIREGAILLSSYCANKLLSACFSQAFIFFKINLVILIFK